MVKRLIASLIVPLLAFMTTPSFAEDIKDVKFPNTLQSAKVGEWVEYEVTGTAGKGSARVTWEIETITDDAILVRVLGAGSGYLLLPKSKTGLTAVFYLNLMSDRMTYGRRPKSLVPKPLAAPVILRKWNVKSNCTVKKRGKVTTTTFDHGPLPGFTFGLNCKIDVSDSCGFLAFKGGSLKSEVRGREVTRTWTYKTQGKTSKKTNRPRGVQPKSSSSSVTGPPTTGKLAEAKFPNPFSTMEKGDWALFEFGVVRSTRAKFMDKALELWTVHEKTKEFIVIRRDHPERSYYAKIATGDKETVSGYAVYDAVQVLLLGTYTSVPKKPNFSLPFDNVAKETCKAKGKKAPFSLDHFVKIKYNAKDTYCTRKLTATFNPDEPLFGLSMAEYVDETVVMVRSKRTIAVKRISSGRKGSAPPKPMYVDEGKCARALLKSDPFVNLKNNARAKFRLTGSQKLGGKKVKFDEVISFYVSKNSETYKLSSSGNRKNGLKRLGGYYPRGFETRLRPHIYLTQLLFSGTFGPIPDEYVKSARVSKTKAKINSKKYAAEKFTFKQKTGTLEWTFCAESPIGFSKLVVKNKRGTLTYEIMKD
ncbi:MAG: hypothetical protein P1V97_27815 [Planctomycetota bacterium]|nr:hypothetical protein [Planctomycetota bacterium]